MYNDIELGMVCIGYMVYIVSLNWVHIKEYKSKGRINE
jgi:hypothetical protein